MSNEIQYSASLQCKNGNFQFLKQGVLNANINQNSAGGGAPGQFTATNAAQGAALVLATYGITAGGMYLICNPDAAATITWGTDNGSGTLEPVEDILPGQFSIGRITAGATTLRFKSTAASTPFQIWILNP